MGFKGVDIARSAFTEAVDKNNDKKIDNAERAIFDPENIAKGVLQRVTQIKEQIKTMTGGDKNAIKALEDKVLPGLERNITDRVQGLKNLKGATDMARGNAARSAAREIYRNLNFIISKQLPNLKVETKVVTKVDGKKIKETSVVNKKAQQLNNDIKIEAQFSEEKVKDKANALNTTSEKITAKSNLNEVMNKHESKITGLVELYCAVYAKTLHESNPDMSAQDVERLYNIAKGQLMKSMGWNGKSFDVSSKQTLKKYLKNVGATDNVLIAVKGFLDLQTHQFNAGSEMGKNWDTDKFANVFRKNISTQLAEVGGNTKKLDRGFSFWSLVPFTERHQIAKQEKFAQIQTSLKSTVTQGVESFDWTNLSTENANTMKAMQGGIGNTIVEDMVNAAQGSLDPIGAISDALGVLKDIPGALSALKKQMGQTWEDVVKNNNPYIAGQTIGHLLVVLVAPQAGKTLSKGLSKTTKYLGPKVVPYVPLRVLSGMNTVKTKVTPMITKVSSVATRASDKTKHVLNKVPGMEKAAKGLKNVKHGLVENRSTLEGVKWTKEKVDRGVTWVKNKFRSSTTPTSTPTLPTISSPVNTPSTGLQIPPKNGKLPTLSVAATNNDDYSSYTTEQLYVSFLKEFNEKLNTGSNTLNDTQKMENVVTQLKEFLPKIPDPNKRRALVYRLVETHFDQLKKVLFPDTGGNRLKEFGFDKAYVQDLALKFSEHGDQKFLQFAGEISNDPFELTQIEQLLHYYTQNNKLPKTNELSIQNLQDRADVLKNNIAAAKDPFASLNNLTTKT